jgi:hypothetical protein
MKTYVAQSSNPGVLYGLGFLGALVYFLTTAGSFTAGVVGIFKAVFWPAFLVYQAFAFMAG